MGIYSFIRSATRDCDAQVLPAELINSIHSCCNDNRTLVYWPWTSSRLGWPSACMLRSCTLAVIAYWHIVTTHTKTWHEAYVPPPLPGLALAEWQSPTALATTNLHTLASAVVTSPSKAQPRSRQMDFCSLPMERRAESGSSTRIEAERGKIGRGFID